MRRIAATALVAAIALLALASAAHAAPPPKYKLDVMVNYAERANLEEGAYPDPCKTWTSARSLLAFSVRSARPVVMGLVRSPLDDSTWGVFPREPEPAADLMRWWRWRVHVTPNTPECTPCGPASAYGLCTGPLPDVIEDDDCGGKGERRRGGILLQVSDAGIAVSAAPGDDMLDCREPSRYVIPLGSADPKVRRLLIANGTRQLRRMKVGQTRTLKRELRRGRCAKGIRGPGLRTCIEQVVTIKATRLR